MLRAQEAGAFSRAQKRTPCNVRSLLATFAAADKLRYGPIQSMLGLGGMLGAALSRVPADEIMALGRNCPTRDVGVGVATVSA
jgi:hypothetical protein